MILNRMKILLNETGGSGGGIVIGNQSIATTLGAITISNSRIQGNSSLYKGGGGIAVRNTAKDVSRIVTIDHSVINYNTSTSNLADGGGITVLGVELTMTHSLRK